MRANGTVVECKAVDTSEGGFGLMCQTSVGMREHVRIAVQMPLGEIGTFRTVVHDGRVTGSVLTPGGYRVGIKLVHPFDFLLDEIDRGSR